ncbi:hypothetical protein LOK49_LG14G01393 [Camellia lanceoleosa]|uniref:Uncharacterized protein n=1 Tax=Camellia lanceoleosa TaxID=1840588 RepID=A0ACC0F960_9ERIC|nr:hypothetical protein LOK49_LG14G01393 [Camellia lanceoleosa]
MAFPLIRECGRVDSSGIEIGSEYSEERQNQRSSQAFVPPLGQHGRRGLYMDMEDSMWDLERRDLECCLIGYVPDVRHFVSYVMQLHINDTRNREGTLFVYGRSKKSFVFLFENEHDMHRITENGPYAIDEAFLVVDYWKPDMILENLVMEKMVVWVKLFGLPLECFMEKVGFRLGRAIGEVTKVDHDTLMSPNIKFLRI